MRVRVYFCKYELFFFVQICGVRDGEAALLAARNGADFIGMIFVPKSKRCVSTEAAKAIVATVRGGCPEAERGDGDGDGAQDEASAALGESPHCFVH